jgi:hypothetical protein
MGRLVRKPQLPDPDSRVAGHNGGPSGVAGIAIGKADPGDGYLERMVKYVPAEIIGCSMIINAILEQAIKSGGGQAAMAGVPVPVIATGALIVACILTPLFCWYVRQDGDAWITNAIVSTIALPFWAYLMGAVAFAPYHDGSLAAILVMSFTMVSGLVAPRPDRPKHREQPQQISARDRPPETAAPERSVEVMTPNRLPDVGPPERLPEVAASNRLPEVAATERLPEITAPERPRLVDVLAR